MAIDRIGVGFGILVLNSSGKILLGRRNDNPEKAKSALHGEGTWTFPGGKLRPGEHVAQGARRELEEEIGAQVTTSELEIICVNEDIVPDAHFITFGLLLRDYQGTVEIREPDEITKWQWFEADNLPSNLFPASRKVLECFQTNRFCLTSKS